MPAVSDESLARTGDEPAVRASVAARLNELVRRSPPLTASLTLHIVVLLALALWIVRAKKPETVVLDLSFASTEVVEELGRLGADVADAGAGRPAAEPSVGHQRDRFAQSHPLDVTGRREHLLHPRTTARPLVPDHDDVTRLHPARQDRLDGLLLRPVQ